MKRIIIPTNLQTQIRISIDARQFDVQSDRLRVRLWSLDPKNGYWINEGNMVVCYSDRVI